jgi:hypothetical protein
VTRKAHPLQDVMMAGGWRDAKALQRVYQAADRRTVARVMEGGVIRSKIVLVLGAGASCGYQYPVGRGLRNRIISNLQAGNYSSEIYSALNRPTGAVESFRDLFLRSEIGSIDEFLNHNPDLAEIGKVAIAQALIPCEGGHKKSMNAPAEKAHLYEYLWHRLAEGSTKDTFNRNNLKVITFNYDRSLEHYLHTAIGSTWRIEAEAAGKLLGEAVEIIHMHGRLAPFTWETDPRVPARAYGTSARPEQLKAEAAGLRIVHDTEQDVHNLRTAQQALLDADRVVFLGFSYHPLNMQRLAIEEKPADRQRLVGSVYGMTDSERGYISRRWNLPQLNTHRDWTCLDVLVENGWLLE